MWLIIPLVYFLGWWQTGSLRQAFNATVAWIVGFSIAAGAFLFLEIGGFSGLTATPDSPAAGLAMFGGFIGYWISNFFWRRRGGDPVREPGKWERTFRATLGLDGKSKKKKKKRAAQRTAPQRQPAPQPPLQQPAGAMPVEAQYRPAQQQPYPQQSAPQPQQTYSASQTANPPATSPSPTRKKQSRNSPTADKYAKATGRALGAMFRSADKKKPAAAAPPSSPQPAPPYQASNSAPQQQSAPPARKKQQNNSPTADKYAKATGRALGAMFRGPKKKKSKNSPKR